MLLAEKPKSPQNQEIPLLYFTFYINFSNFAHRSVGRFRYSPDCITIGRQDAPIAGV
jgi:hypothetical protein